MTPNQIYDLYRKFPAITTDSRNVPAGSIFFAIRGEQFDGNDFAAEALEKGAAFTIIDKPSVKTNDRFILVDDVLLTLQQVARIHRNRFKSKVIGITGSNGKTTTKELIGRTLSTKYKTIVTRGNLNNHIGVPVTILAVSDDTEFAVIEMGANHPGEIAQLCRIARPDFGIVTNIGKAHLEGFGSLEGVIKAKSELYDFLRENKGIAFINLDNEILVRQSHGIGTVTYGTGDNAACRGRINMGNPLLNISWSSRNSSGTIQTNLFGNYNFENILAAICIAEYFDVGNRNITGAISSYVPDNNRSQLKITSRNSLIMDAYNANPSSMKAAISNFNDSPASQKMLILGDMMELGEYSPEEHLAIVKLIREFTFSGVVFIGEQFCQAAKGGTEICFPDIHQAEIWFSDHPVNNMAILIKGSRKMQLEKISALL